MLLTHREPLVVSGGGGGEELALAVERGGQLLGQQREVTVQYSTVQYSTVQYSTGHGAGHPVQPGDDQWF